MAPGYSMVQGLIDDLFDCLKNDTDIDIIKSCVFHYEIEFIHPFEGGNGRVGRFWQTRILMEINPIFEYVPVEEATKNEQESYYKTLEESDKSGKSTGFIEFMLEVINRSLQKTIDESRHGSPDYKKRGEDTLSVLNDWFDRKEYMKINKGISTATASRDLRQLLDEGKIEVQGNARMTRYKKVI